MDKRKIKGSARGKRNVTDDETIRRVVEFYLAMEKPSKGKALIAGGYSKKTVKTSGTAWFFNRDDVKARLKERREELAEKSGVTPEALIERLRFLAFGDLSKFIKIEADGTLSHDFTDATPEELKLVNSLTVDKYTEGRGPGAKPVKKFKVTTLDALRAIELLGRLIGAFQDNMTVKTEVTLVERLRQGREQVSKAARGDNQGETEQS